MAAIGTIAFTFSLWFLALAGGPQSDGMPDTELSAATSQQVTGVLPGTDSGILPAHQERADGVVLSNGSVVNVKWHTRPTEPFDLTEPIAQHYTMLKIRAEAGSSFASVNLYDLLTTCQVAYENQEQLDAAIDLAYQTRKLQTADMPEPLTIGEPDKLEEYIDVALRQPFDSCKGLTSEQKAEASSWLKLAADQGDALAMIEHSRTIENNDIAEGYLEQAWMKGDSTALKYLSQRYADNYETGNKPEDNVKSYAAFYAYTQIISSGMDGHGDIAGRHVARNLKILEAMTQKMRPAEVAEAVKMSDELIRSNPNCCYSM